jgi:threonine/homoserine/homoserine lactone efflux protein
MDLKLVLEGAIIGFSIAMPVGPIGLLCIRNSLTKGLQCGLATGLGAACADALYGACAGFGVAAITSLLVSYKVALQICGGLFLCYLGASMFRVKEAGGAKEIAHKKFWPIFATTFFLTLTNPMTILSFVAIYAGLGIGNKESSVMSAFMLTGGVFLGSALWWLILSTLSSLFKNCLTRAGSRWLNRVSGSIIFGFGLAALCVA